MDLNEVYDRLPTERYCSGCHACAIRCSGDVPAVQAEWDRITEHLRESLAPVDVLRILTEDKRFSVAAGYTIEFCPLYDMKAKACSVYEVRPLVCRMLGFVEWMPCPIERPLPVVDEAPDVMRAYARLRPKPIPQWLAETPLPARRQASHTRFEVA
jgi:hypothetical protein